MAGKKKANSSRGFATTSVIKSKEPAPETEPVPVPERVPVPEPVPVPLQDPVAAETGASAEPGTSGDVDDGFMTLQEREQLLKDARRAESLAGVAFNRANDARLSLLRSASVPSVALPPLAERDLFLFLHSQQQQELQEQDGNDMPSIVPATPSDSTASSIDGPKDLQLHQMYIWLQKLGFHDDDVEHALTAVAGRSVDAAVEWLCLNMPLDKLPSQLTDKLAHDMDDAPLKLEAAQADRQADAQAVASSNPTPASQPQGAWDQETSSTVEQPDNESAADRDGDGDGDADRAASKAWILQQLAKHDASDNEAPEDEDDESDLLAMMNREPRRSKKKGGGSAEAKSKKAVQARQQYEQQTKEKEKVESKQDAPFARLDDAWEVIGEADDAMHTTAAAGRDDDEGGDDDGDIMGAMFDEEAAAQEAANAPASVTIAAAVYVRDMTDTTKWTGSQPIDLLQQWIVKNAKGSTMSFYPLECSNGFRSGLRFSTGHGRVSLSDVTFEMLPDEAVSNKLDARQFVATRALYELAQQQTALVRNLPPKYADLWREWTTAKTAAEEEALVASSKRRIAFLRKLVDDMPKQTSNRGKDLATSPTGASPSDLQPLVVPPPATSSQTQKESARLKSVLASRSASPAVVRLMATRATLPVFQFKAQVLDAISSHQVVILSGDTGSGKSTQVPQFLLEQAIAAGEGGTTRILCTQPRRISAVSLAERVSQEMGDDGPPGSPGSWVGYQVRLESKTTASTRLTFCTTGVLLRRMESDATLSNVTHVVVDEVHERTLDSDFLLFLLRRLMPRRPDLRIVLMSATAEASFFAKYFETGTGVLRVPCLLVPGKTHPVTVGFLEDAVQQSDYKMDEFSEFAIARKQTGKNSATVTVSSRGGNSYRQTLVWEKTMAHAAQGDLYYDEEEDEAAEEGAVLDGADKRYKPATLRTVALMDPRKINFALIEHLVFHIIATEPPSDGCDGDVIGSILVFLPGLAEIRRLSETLDARSSEARGPKLWILCLHSALTGQDQSLVFKPAPKGTRKVVLATNVAETGITIPDVVYVIDSGRAREVCYDEKRKMRRLTEVLVSKANCKQRAGRAGRVRPGKCFHLMPKSTHDALLDARPPEMMRLELDEICLRARAILGGPKTVGSLQSLLADMPSPPSTAAVERSVSLLEIVEALDAKENLTRLGKILANLPVDVRLGKMLLYAAFFGCLEPVLTMCAVLSLGKTPFTRPMGHEQAASAAHAAFCRGDSDLLTYANAYDRWRAKVQASGGTGKHAVRVFCETAFLNSQNLDMIHETRNQLRRTLASIGLSSHAASASSANPPARHASVVLSSGSPLTTTERLVQTVYAGSLYPNLLVLDPPPGKTKALMTPQERAGHLHMPNKTEAVAIHKTSVVKQSQAAADGAVQWFAYHAIKVDKSYGVGGTTRERATVLDANATLGLAVALLCGRTAAACPSLGSLQLDHGLVVIKCPPRTCSALLVLRRELNACFDAFLASAWMSERAMMSESAASGSLQVKQQQTQQQKTAQVLDMVQRVILASLA